MPGILIHRLTRYFSWRGQLLLMVMPFAVGITLLIFLPALLSLPLAFTNYNALDPPTFVGLQNFRELWSDSVFRTATVNTLGFMAGTVTLRLVASLVLALFLMQRIRGVVMMRTAIVLPTVAPDIAWSLAWLWILNPIYGPLNLLLGAVGIDGPAWMLDESGARLAIVLMVAWQFGEGFIVCLAALSDIPTEIHDLADLDGSRLFEKFRSIILPFIAPYLLVLAVRDMLWSMRANFVPAIIMGQDGGPNYATTYISTWTYTNAFDYLRLGYASAITWMTFLMSFVLLGALYLITSRRRMALHL